MRKYLWVSVWKLESKIKNFSFGEFELFLHRYVIDMWDFYMTFPTFKI